MCMTCKVTKHITHESQTIDEALQQLIPEKEKGTEFIDENIDVLAKSLEDVGMKITEIKESYVINVTMKLIKQQGQGNSK